MVSSTSSSILSTKSSSISLSSTISATSSTQTSSVISSTKSSLTSDTTSSGSSSTISSSKSSSLSQSTASTFSTTNPGTISSTSTSATTLPTLHIVPSVGLYNYAGCYTEANGVRALGAAFYPTDSQTVELCVAACATTPYKYAGLEYARECWCADTFGTGSTLVPDTDCSMSCAGDAYEYCGGGNRLTVYIRNGTNQKILSTSSSSTPFGSSSSSKLATSLFSVSSVSTTSKVPSSSTLSTSTLLPSSSPSSKASYSSLRTSTTSKPSSSTTTKPTQTAPAIKLTISLPTTGNLTYMYLSCYTEGSSSRALNQAAFYNYTSMSLEMCAQNCAGSKYWGTEYGGECKLILFLFFFFLFS